MSQNPNEPLLRQTALSPIEPLLRDPEIRELMIDGCERVYVEKRDAKGFVDVPTPFHTEQEVYDLITAILEPMGRRADESNPIVNVRLPDGSLVLVVVPPIALNGPSVTMRKTMGRSALTIELLLEYNCLSKAEADFLQACVLARLNVVIAGGTASGKTTMLNILSRWIPDDERIIVCQTETFQLNKPHVVNLETRPANLEGRGEVNMHDLVNAARFMRPDRIIVSEIRGSEVVSLLDLMNNGHDGTMFTLHGTSPRDALSRMEVMAGFANPPMPVAVVREQTATALNLIICQELMPDGTRKITRISEVVGIEEGVVATRDLFEFRRTGMKDGRVQGYHTATGAIPTFLERLHEYGEYWQKALPVSLFVPSNSSQ